MSLNPRLTNWQGRRVWLVGASSGIGLALALALHREGARVIVSARNAGALADFVRNHPGSTALPLDVTDLNAVVRAAAAVAHAGPLDLLWFGAGHYKPMRANQMDLTEMLRHHQVNTVGALHLVHSVTPHLLQQGHGHVSLVSSVAGFGGLPQSLAYGPTKAALINLAETLYLDLRQHGLGVSLINPGFVDTPLTANNPFHMPALITAHQAAEAILEGWARGRFEIHFPKRFTWAMKLLGLLPYPLYFAAVRRFTGL